ncbi:ROK family transcriptional regulator [Arthrobacter sp. NPDC055138]
MSADPPSTLDASSRSVPRDPQLRPGSQGALRRRNSQRILQSLMARGPLTQAELSRQTGLSTATVSNIVKAMAEDGLISTEPTTSSGRRALSVRIDGRGAVAVGVDFGRRHVQVVLVSLDHRVLAADAVELPLGHDAEQGIDAAARLVQRLLDEQSVSPGAVLGVGAGIPGPIDRRTGTVIHGAILPEWVGINLLARLQERFGADVFVDNDANLGALAQVSWGPYQHAQNLVFLKIGSGIGAGLVLNGELYYGHIGVTGEIGHATVAEHGVICRCGNRGCLETVASTSTMIDLLSHGRNAPIGTEDIVRIALDGDPAALRVIDDAGLAVGRALANVCNLLNPEFIVVGGPLTGLGGILLDPVRRGLLRHVVPVVGESTELAMSTLGSRAEALGAATLVLQQAELPFV